MRTIIALILAVSISGCAATSQPVADRQAGSQDRAVASVATSHDQGRQVAGIALSMVGTPYRFGGASPASGFDCSGLVYYSFQQSGMGVPRTSQEQFRSAQRISLSDARHGDLLFFADQEKLSHVGIYIGERRFVHAPASGRSVSIGDVDNPWYQMHLVGVGRLTR